MSYGRSLLWLLFLTTVWFPSLATAQGVTSFTINGEGVAEYQGSGGSAANQGDLWFDVTCEGAAFAQTWDDPVYLQLSIWVEGQKVAGYSTTFGYGEAYGTLTAHFRASTENRRIECDADGPYSTGMATGTVFGSGPGSGTLKVSSFIPYNWIGNPENTFRVFEGDNRDFSQYDVTSRSVQIYDILNPAVNDGNIGTTYDAVGQTIEYDAPTSLDAPMPYGQVTQQARDDWTWDPPLKTRWDWADAGSMHCSVIRDGPGPATSTNEVTCVGSASNPLIAGAPAIDWNISFQMVWGLNKVVITPGGCHDGFPSFEAYMNGVTLYQHHDDGDVSHLWGSCDVAVAANAVEVPR